MNIICSTGLYTEKEGSPAYWQSKMAWGIDISRMIVDLMIREIVDGIGSSSVKAGVIKVASGPAMTPYEEATHKAAAVAQKATGVPIVTHTEGPTGGPEQASFLLKQGADPNKVMIGHVNNSGDIGYHRSILASGMSIGFDRLGLGPVLGVPDSVSVRNIARLCDEGFENKILLSQDTVNFWLGRPTDLGADALAMFDDWKIDHISRKILPMLKAHAVTDEQINMMMIDNPRNLFLGK